MFRVGLAQTGTCQRKEMQRNPHLYLTFTVKCDGTQSHAASCIASPLLLEPTELALLRLSFVKIH